LIGRPCLRLPSGGRRRRRAAGGLALAIAVAVVVVILTNTGSPSSSNAASSDNGISGAATVTRQNLIETDTESGTVSYANPQTVYSRLSGTITWLPSVGHVIRPGQTLYKVNGEPVVLMNGTTPAYRSLTPSESDGPDITQLNRDLVALGFNPDGIVVDDAWQAATTAGVELLQESLGESETGTLSLGQIVFLPGAQVVTTVAGTLGGTDASTSVDPPAPEFVSLTSTTPATTSSGPARPPATTTTPPSTTLRRHNSHKGGSTNKQTLAALIALLRAEIAQLKAEHSSSPSSHGPTGNTRSGSSNSTRGSSGNGSSASGNSGNSGNSAQAILQTSSTQLVVTVDLAASSQSEARIGEHVTVEMPSVKYVDGTITAVSSVAQSSNSDTGNTGNNGNGNDGNNGNNGNSGSGSGATIPVTIALHGHLSAAGLDQAAVSVNFVEAVARNVLSVPVTALLATAGGGYAVQEAAAPHKLLPVTTGLFAAGDVQISGPGIYPGLRVTDSQG
jgi:hypothetical protein